MANEGEADGAPAEASPAARRGWLAWAGIIGSAALFGIAIAVLFFVARDLDLAQMEAALAKASRGQLVLALLFTALSYLMLTGYDALALRHVTTIPVRYSIAALASFTSYAISFTLGFPLLTAATVRYWIYAPLGLSAKAVAGLTAIAGVTFWLGMGTVLAVVLLAQPAAASAFTRLPLVVNMLVGGGIFAAVGLYLLLVNRGGRVLSVQGWRLRLPGVRITLAQMALGAADVCAGGAVLYVLLPEGHGVAFATVVAAYVFACVLGIASHAPGGIGVFEATILIALPGIPKEGILGTLLLYRICYYLVPFVIALCLLGGREILLRALSLRRLVADDARTEEAARAQPDRDGGGEACR